MTNGGCLPGQSANIPVSGLTVQRAGFWIRVAAGLFDLLILAIPVIVFVSFLSVGMGSWVAFLDLHPGESPDQIHALFGPTFLVLTLVFFVLIEWLYFAILESSSWRATLGKRLLGLQVGDVDGNPVRFLRASGRFFGGRLLMQMPSVGLYYFLVDCACIGMVPGKRAIHDMLAGCLVLRKSADG
jgi:uncharacterized RDD family membrane protein YckC